MTARTQGLDVFGAVVGAILVEMMKLQEFRRSAAFAGLLHQGAQSCALERVGRRLFLAHALQVAEATPSKDIATFENAIVALAR